MPLIESKIYAGVSSERDVDEVDWHKLFSANGRTGRLTWWRIYLLIALLWFAAAALFSSDGNVVFRGVGLFLSIVVLRIAVVTAIKRCHDHGWSGWWAWMALVPLIGFFWFGVMPGQREPNKHGAHDSGSPFRNSSRVTRTA